MSNTECSNDTDDEGCELSDRQQKLLCRYFDGECTVFQYWKAKRLLGKSSSARSYVRDLKLIEGVVCEKADELPPIDLWGRISARIEAEEDAEVFLGGREHEHRPSLGARIGEWFADMRSGLTWAAGGASLASACAFGLVYSGMVGREQGADLPPGTRLVSPVAVSRGGSISPIALTRPKSNMSFEREAEIAGTDFDTGSRARRSPFSSAVQPSLAAQSPSAFEIDWVRSEGRLHLLQDPGEKTAIIWVKPRQQSSNAYAAARLSKRFSKSSSLPIAVPVAGR